MLLVQFPGWICNGGFGESPTLGGLRVAVFIACVLDLLRVIQKRESVILQAMLVLSSDHHLCDDYGTQ
jgi:hypothetical protein